MSSDPTIHWYKSPLDRQKLKELTTKSDSKALSHLLVHILFSISTGVIAWLAFRYLSWPFVILALFIHGTFYNFLGDVHRNSRAVSQNRLQV